MTKAVGAFLVMASIFCLRGAARELALPLDGLERLARAPRTPTTEPDTAIETAFEIAAEIPETATPPTEPPAETDPWDDWRAQAIAALPEELRTDSEHRRAIVELYNGAVGQSLVEISVDFINNRPPVGVHEGPFTDIDERADSAPGSGLVPGFERFTLQGNGTNGGDVEILLPLISNETTIEELVNWPMTPRDYWIAQWNDWRNQAIAALPEAERKNPNYLKVVDTTYEEMVKLAPASTPPQATRISYQLTWTNP